MFSSVVQVTKVCVREVLASRPFRFLRRNSAGEGVILMYHSLCRDSAELPSSPNESYFRPNIALSVTEKRFRAQMRYLQRNFEVVSLPECLERLRSPGRKNGGNSLPQLLSMMDIETIWRSAPRFFTIMEFLFASSWQRAISMARGVPGGMI